MNAIWQCLVPLIATKPVLDISALITSLLLLPPIITAQGGLWCTYIKDNGIVYSGIFTTDIRKNLTDWFLW